MEDQLTYLRRFNRTLIRKRGTAIGEEFRGKGPVPVLSLLI